MFRIDKRTYAPEDQIVAAKEYMQAVDRQGELLEGALERARPADKPQRREALFVFEQYCCALKFWSKHPTSSFYEVEAIGPVHHRGDMLITERMYTNDGDFETSAKEYWDSHSTPTPCWEDLVSSARVIKIISNSETQRKAVFLWIQGSDPVDYRLPDVQELIDGCYGRPPKAVLFSYGSPDPAT